ncbi:MAG: hypothetical protein MdMp014T_2478 [Treponematales bacterium]
MKRMRKTEDDYLAERRQEAERKRGDAEAEAEEASRERWREYYRKRARAYRAAHREEVNRKTRERRARGERVNGKWKVDFVVTGHCLVITRRARLPCHPPTTFHFPLSIFSRS